MPKFIFQIRKKLHGFWFLSIKVKCKNIFYNKYFFICLIYFIFMPTLYSSPNLLLFFKCMTHLSFNLIHSTSA